MAFCHPLNKCFMVVKNLCKCSFCQFSYFLMLCYFKMFLAVKGKKYIFKMANFLIGSRNGLSIFNSLSLSFFGGREVEK